MLKPLPSAWLLGRQPLVRCWCVRYLTCYFTYVIQQNMWIVNSNESKYCYVEELPPSILTSEVSRTLQSGKKRKPPPKHCHVLLSTEHTKQTVTCVRNGCKPRENSFSSRADEVFWNLRQICRSYATKRQTYQILHVTGKPSGTNWGVRLSPAPSAPRAFDFYCRVALHDGPRGGRAA